MSEIFDSVNLYKHYSRAIINERNLHTLNEKESITKFNNTDFKKFKIVLYYDNDPKLIPASFQVDYIYSIEFNIKSIINDFSKEQINFNKNINIDDNDIQKMVMNKMRGKTEKNVRKSVIDIDKFYNEFFKKKFPSYVLYSKLNDLIRAGVLPIENWKIYAIIYSTQVTDKLLFRKLESGLKKGTPIVSSLYGYQIAFESANKMKTYSKEEVMEFTKEFSREFEKSILVDSKYYKIIKK